MKTKNGYHRGRMLKEYKEPFLDPKRCAKAGEVFQGSLPLTSFTLPAEVLKGSNEIHYQLQFGVDSEDYVYIHGFIEAVLQLQCQRCLGPMDYKIHSEFSLSPVQDGEDAQALPEHYDPILMDHDRLSVLRLVEDELILSLPLASVHDKEC